VEVKGRRASATSQNFVIKRGQLEDIKRLPNSLYVLINKYGYKIIPAVDVENLSDKKFLINMCGLTYIPINLWLSIARLVKSHKEIPGYVKEAICEKLQRDGVKMKSKLEVVET